MKKIIQQSILAISSLALSSVALAQNQQCTQPTDRDYAYLLINVLRTNNSNSPSDVKKIDNLLNYYCYNFNVEKGIENPIFSIYSPEVLKIFDSKNVNLTGIKSKKYGLDIFSSAILFSEKYKNKEFATSRSNDYSKSYKDLFPQEAVPITFNIKDEQYKEVFDILNEKYKKRTTVSEDIFGNSLLHYLVVTNHPEYIDSALGAYSDGKFSLKNKKGLTPLHLIFSPTLKGKDVKALNDRILKSINERDLLKSRILNINYHAFATLMQENNPDFYKKFNEKFPLKTGEYQTQEQNKKTFKENLNKDLDIINAINFF